MEQFLDTFLNWKYLVQIIPELFQVGLKNTLLIAFLAILGALGLGVVFSLLLISRHVLVRLPARIYVDVFRGLPAILAVLLVGAGLPIAGFEFFGRNTYAYAVLALALINGAYVSEILRSGIQSVDKGQAEAARSLGMSYLQTMALVVIPQGLRRVLPALTNQFIICVKESALVYLLGITVSQRELFTVGLDLNILTGSLTGLTAAGMFYLAIVIPMTYGVNWLDRHLREGKSRPMNIVDDEGAPLATEESVLPPAEVPAR